MKALKLSIAVILASGAVATTAFVHQASGQGTPINTVQKSPLRLLFAQPFFLDQSYQHAWRSDQPTYSAGYVIAVAADPEVMPVMQVHHPLMFVGDMPIERVNDGWQSGVVVGFVPSPVKDGQLTLDLATTPIFWAKPDILPEALTASQARAELERAIESGAVAQQGATVQSAVTSGGGAVYVETHGMLQRYVADVIERFSPGEVDLISGLRAPLVH